MKRIIFLLLPLIISMYVTAQSVGIGTTTPNANALLHLDIGSSTTKGILITGIDNLTSTVPNLGSGSRLMFYPGKAAFRAGYVSGSEWDNNNVGFNSTALGNRTVASGLTSTAMGSNSSASGYISTSMGSRTNAGGDYSTAMGQLANASGFNSTAMGSVTIASGDYSTAMTYNTYASGDYSTAMGFYSKSSGYTSTAMGSYTTAGGIYSTSMGRQTIAKGFASTVIGLYNDSILTANQTSISSTTPLFIIGNGSSTTRSNAMVVLKNGYVGLGSDAPTENLVINDPVNPTLELQTAGVEKGFYQLSGDNVRLGTYSSNSTGNVIVRLNGGDRLTIYPTGNAPLTGTLTQNSDARLKTNIAAISNALPMLMQLSGYHYIWKNENLDSTLQTGVLAQEVQSILPELVKKDAEGTLSVNYSGLIPYIIQSIKEQQNTITKQQEIQLLQQQQINKLMNEVSRLKEDSKKPK